MTGMSNTVAYSIARRITLTSSTGSPSSDTATATASTISPISESSSPFMPLVMEPMGYTRAFLACAAFLRMNSVTAALSFGGSVFAIVATAVNPPATAACEPLAIVSLYSKSGSRR